MWGILITSLNRLVFASIKTFDRSFSSSIVSLLPRILVAISIAFTLALPFQLKIFENSIDYAIFQQRQELIATVVKDYKKQIDLKNDEKAMLENRLLEEISGKGATGKWGDAAVANTLKVRIQGLEVAITNLNIEAQNYRQEI